MAFGFRQASPCCFLLLFTLLPFSSTAQSYSNRTLGSSLVAQDDYSAWASSPSGDFTFGFQKIGNDGFLLAIWFGKIPEKTIVWSANRNDLVQKGSKVELTTDGRLVLWDQRGRQIWAAVSANPGVSHAAMLDTGNLVLASQDSRVLWQSFDYPTDTILPTQAMNLEKQVIARYTEMNYSSGRFKFMLQSDGNLLLYTTNFPFTDAVTAYWSTQDSIGSGFQVIFNQSGYIYLAARNGTLLNTVFPALSSSNAQDFYLRATVDYDGVLRQYAYPKSSVATSNGTRAEAWTTLSFQPSNICKRIVGRGYGGGACGYNSYCMLSDDEQRPICQCIPGYSFIDTNDIRKGCRPDFGFCDEASQKTNLFEFATMERADWFDSSYEDFEGVTEDWCRQACLSDCFCAVATFKEGECKKKRIPLSNGIVDPDVDGKALVKVRKDNANDESRWTLIRVGSVLLGGSTFLNLLLFLLTLMMFSRLKRKEASIGIHPQKLMPTIYVPSFTYSELEKATNGFEEELGRGAFGIVYKGDLPSEPRKSVAVKKLDNTERNGEQEFEAEVTAVGRTNHKNLVQLLGFCNEGQNRLLVYEYMRNGSLAKFLFKSSRPDWYERMKIVFGTAEGICYLHEECSSCIIHCDIKPENILLDDSLSARISDFGLAKLLKNDQTRTITAIRGTKGYVAPEWFRNMAITVKVDVYSFGILLLEVICCRKNFEKDVEEEDRMILADWAYDCYVGETLHLLVEEDEEAMTDMKKVKKFVMIAIWCIQEDPSLRPTMKKVIQMMEGAVAVPVPPNPTSFLTAI
ncbi:hypothetical protein like AT5G24080 [Hibiscus trionum]|uniref:Receptor-like serine/threonine-protein kinase n=1 Tax=Hibiscus trionum TaxID=183268 RepID=A0A9W7M7E1_HIBTR|nr:hypothetical protein like AT5G24080 [Hibiscus trionum]